MGYQDRYEAHIDFVGHLGARTRFKTLIYLKRFGAGACGALVSTSKFLAQMNKTQDVVRATEGMFGPTVSVDAEREGPNSLRSRSALLAPAFNGRGLFPLARCCKVGNEHD